MRNLLLLPLLLGFSVPAIAHNEANGGRGHNLVPHINLNEESEKGEGADLTGGENLCLGALDRRFESYFLDSAIPVNLR